MHAIFKALPGLMDELASDEAREAVIFAMFPTVLGEHLCERSAPLRLEGSTLFVAVPDPEWEREFTQHASEIVYKLNRTLGTPVVKRITPIVDEKSLTISKSIKGARPEQPSMKPAALPNLKKASAKISDTGLRKHFLEAATLCIQRRDSN
jgi:hypothetical protein